MDLVHLERISQLCQLSEFWQGQDHSEQMNLLIQCLENLLEKEN